jgi:hypothetical protein
MLIHTIGGGYSGKMFFFKIEHVVSKEEKPVTVTLFDHPARVVHTHYLSIPIEKRQRFLADVCDEFLAKGTVSEIVDLSPLGELDNG